MKNNSTRLTVFSCNFFFTFVLLALNLALVPLVEADVLDSSLIVRLNFDAAPVNDVIVDTSPADGHPGTNNLATWVATEAGRPGVMNFDGTVPNQITVAADPALNSAVGTIAFWMKSTNVTQTPNAYAMLFDRRTAGGDVIYQEPGGHLSNQAQQTTGNAANSQTTLASSIDGQWHHIAYVYDQSVVGTVSFYVDGVLDTTATNNLAWSWPADQEIEIGASSQGTFWAGYTGFLDDFRVYNRMLSASEVADVAGLGTTPQIIVNAGGQPQDLTVAEKDTAAFTVKAAVANGDAAQLHYQWQKDGVDITGATTSSYSFTAAAADTGKKFRVQLSYPGATNVTSAEVTLTVVPELVVIYSFDAAPVGDVIVDTTTNATKHNGTNFGATWIATQDGHTGVMSLDGIAENRITVAPAPELDSVRGTIAFWMKSPEVTANDNGNYAPLFSRRTASRGDVIYQDPTGHMNNQAQASGTTVNGQTTGLNVTDNTWHHIAYLYDQRAGGSVSFYVDGVLDTSKVNSAAWAWVPEEQLIIGDSSESFWSAYTGFLDEFRIYNRVLTPSEIAQLAGLGPQPQIVITRQPVNFRVGVNDTATFSVTANVINGAVTNLLYQWQKEGTNISGATKSSYAFPVTAADDGKKFRVQLSYPGTTNVISAEATLTVLPEFVVQFAFDAAPQGDVIVDSAPDGVANNGVNDQATWVATQDGRTGVMSFDPTVPSRITLPGTPDLNSMRGTIAFWMESVLVTPFTTEPMILDRRAMPADGVPVTGGDVLYQLADGHVSDQAEVAGRSRANQFSTAHNPTDGKWHHVAYVYDQTAKGSVTYYVDGVLDGSHNNSQAWYWVTDELLEFGKSHDSYWAAYNGFLDDFRIYNRVLSANEIAELAGVGPVPSATLGFTVAGGKLTLTWSQTGFVLQENSNLTNSAGWTNVPNGDVSPVVITLPATGANFYRLKKP